MLACVRLSVCLGVDRRAACPDLGSATAGGCRHLVTDPATALTLSQIETGTGSNAPLLGQ